MNYSKITFASAFLAFALSLGASSLRAQEEPAQQQPPPDAPPKPAAKTFPVPVILYGDQEDDSNRNGLRGDYTPLTGIQNATLGIPDFEAQDAEAIYDSLLVVSDRLDENRFGPADPVQIRPDGRAH